MRTAIKIALLVCFALVGAAHAAPPDCTVTFTGITFSAYSSTNTLPDDGIGTITVTCSSNNSRTATVAITPTTGRVMSSGANTLQYNVYTNSGRTTVWGDGTSGATVSVSASTSCGTNCYTGSATVYGRIPISQVTAAAGTTLSQTLTVTISGYGGPVGTDTTTGVVQVTTAASCSISSAGTMNFGTLGLGFITTDKSGVSAIINYTCTSGLSATIRLGQGSNPASGSSDAAPSRRMRLGATSNYVNYNLYKDIGNTQVWGNTVATGVGPIAGTGSGQTVTVYGKAIHANIPTGIYTDIVVVTIDF